MYTYFVWLCVGYRSGGGCGWMQVCGFVCGYKCESKCCLILREKEFSEWVCESVNVCFRTVTLDSFVELDSHFVRKNVIITYVKVQISDIWTFIFQAVSVLAFFNYSCTSQNFNTLYRHFQIRMMVQECLGLLCMNWLSFVKLH